MTIVAVNNLSMLAMKYGVSGCIGAPPELLCPAASLHSTEPSQLATAMMAW
jgi:hypothetical protein